VIACPVVYLLQFYLAAGCLYLLKS
jgi:hypothetical protein